MPTETNRTTDAGTWLSALVRSAAVAAVGCAVAWLIYTCFTRLSEAFGRLPQ